MQDVSMWCPKCEVYTKSYTPSGLCDNCGTDVISGEFSRIDIDFEGTVEVLKNGALKLIERR